MHVREATLDDKDRWDSFVDSEGGSFFHYFDWRHIYDTKGSQYIPILIENNIPQIIGILPIVKKKSSFYSNIASLPGGASGGIVFKKELTDAEKYQVAKRLLRYVDKHYSQGCSRFIIKENLMGVDEYSENPTKIFIDEGFRFKYDKKTGLPCTHVLELTKSFERDIWNKLWSSSTRRQIRQLKKKGVHVREDKNLQYMDDFVKMFSYTYEHLGSFPIQREEVVKRLTIFSKKTKVFVAFLEEKPIGAVLCYYMPTTCYWSKLVYYDVALKNNASRLLLCEAIQDVCKNGYQYFEFGVTNTLSLAVWKKHFKGTKIPMRIYEKRYSIVRTLIEKVDFLIKWIPGHKRFIWNNRRRLISKVIRRGI